MKNQKGMGLLMLIICICFICMCIIGIIYVLRENIQNEKIETYKTNMLLIQGKIKVISKEAIVEKNDDVLKGRKLSDAMEEENVKTLLENNIVFEEEENFSKYYILEQGTLDEMGLNIKLKEDYYIVNYATYEIIYSKGIEAGKTRIYKLSEIKQKTIQNEINEEI